MTCRNIEVLHYRITALPHYRITALPHYRITALPHYRMVQLPHYRNIEGPQYRIKAAIDAVLIVCFVAVPQHGMSDVMQTIVLASRKGGAGKTTISCHLAVEAERAGAGPVAVIDTDVMLGLSKWWDARKADTPLLAEAIPNLASALEVLREAGYKTVFVDTPPAFTHEVKDTIALADLVLIPVQPSPDDLRAVQTTVEMVTEAKKRSLFIINRAKNRVRLTAQAVAWLSQYSVVCTTFLADRVDYAAAKIDGLTAPELDPHSLAAGEVRELWFYISSHMTSTIKPRVEAFHD